MYCKKYDFINFKPIFLIISNITQSPRYFLSLSAINSKGNAWGQKIYCLMKIDKISTNKVRYKWVNCFLLNPTFPSLFALALNDFLLDFPSISRYSSRGCANICGFPCSSADFVSIVFPRICWSNRRRQSWNRVLIRFRIVSGKISFIISTWGVFEFISDFFSIPIRNYNKCCGTDGWSIKV